MTNQALDITETTYRRVDIPNQGSSWDTETKINVCFNYLVHGNTRKVSEMSGVPQNTILYWKQSEWWQELSNKLWEENKEELNAGYSRILSRTIERIEEKIEEPEIKAVDLAKVHGILFDKRQILNNQPTSIKSGVDNEQLKDLKRQFEALAGKTIEGDRVD